MSTVRYYLGGFDQAAPAQNKAEQWDDPSQTYTAWDKQGNVTSTRPYTAAEIVAANAAAATATAASNAATLRSRAQTALTNNETFLALASPTNAQVLAQVQALTRQVDGLIRLDLSLLDTITDA